jgi:hypothetical protein
MKSSAAGVWATSSTLGMRVGSGTARGETGYSRSPLTLKGAAGHEHGEVRAGAEEVDHLGRGFRHVLEVVEHQKEFPLAQVLAKNLQRAYARGFPQAQSL